MKYSSYIDNITTKKWGLSINQAYLFDWIYTLPSWAETVVYENETYYFASRNKACKELSNLTTKPDTIYRHYKKLEEFGLIKLIKIAGKDYIKLTKKAGEWGRNDSSEYSEKNPSKLGKISENNSEKFPTNKIIRDNKITSNKRGGENKLFPDHSPTKKTLFSNSVFKDYKLFEKQFTNPLYQEIDLSHYYWAVHDWSDSSNTKRTAKGWIATARNFMRGDREKNKLKTKGGTLGNNSEEMLNFLKRK